MKQINIAAIGISGVGKTTFLNAVARRVRFQHLTGGSLISAARQKSLANRDSLRLDDIAKNQRLLIDGFNAARSPEYEVAILDGHILIDADSEIQIIDYKIFEELNIAAFLHISTTVERISYHRSADTSRKRPIRTETELAEQQGLSENYTKSAASALRLPFKRFELKDADIAADFITRIKLSAD